MVNPCGLSEPLSVAAELVTLVAVLAVTTGGPVAVRVVNVLSLPNLVPPAVAGYDSEMINAVCH